MQRIAQSWLLGSFISGACLLVSFPSAWAITGCDYVQGQPQWNSINLDAQKMTDCVLEGTDPPVEWRANNGIGSGFSGMGQTSFAANCPPGGFNCPVSKAIDIVSLPSLPFGNIPTFNIPPISLPGLPGLPALPCGGAVPLINQVFNVGNNIKVGNVPAATSGAVGIINTIMNCKGGFMSVAKGAVSLVLPPGSPASNIANGALNAANGSYLNIPAGTPVDLAINVAGSLILPSGGSFTGPGGVPITLPDNTVLTMKGNGDIQLPDGSVINFPNGTVSIPLNTSSIGIPTTNAPFKIDTTGIVSTPQAVGTDPILPKGATPLR